MKQLFLALGIISVMGLQSCSEDFNVAAPYRQISVVAGVLDRADSAHYIRIEKGFMDEQKSAITMSKEPDSSFFKNLSVILYEYNPAQTAIIDSAILYRVDLNNEGYKKEEPVNDQQFFTSPNFAYKFTNATWKTPHALNPANWYKLMLHNLDNNSRDSSDFVGIVNDDPERNSVYGEGFYIPEFTNANYDLDFSRTANATLFRLLVLMPRNGRRAEGFIKFNYVEKDLATQQKTRKSVLYAFDTEESITKAGSNFNLTVPNSNIYAFLSSAIGAAPNNIERYMDSCDIYIYAASPEMYYYSTINQGQAGGITSDNIQPNYTNFKSDNVIGVLGSRSKRVYYQAEISAVTLDSLMKNQITQPLRIRGVSED